MKNKERLDFRFQTRISQSQKEKLDELGAEPREVVDYYIRHNTNPTLKLKNRQKELLKNIAEWKSKISEAEEELKEVNDKLGVPTDKNTATLEVSTIGERIKDNCQSENNGKCDKSRLANFIVSGRGKSILKLGLTEFNIRDNEKRQKFKEDVFKYLSISDVEGIDKLEI